MNSITFFAPSGSPASNQHTSLVTVEQLTTPGNTSGANHVGFFGAGGPEGTPFAIIIGRYQDETYITNASGTNLGAAPWGLPGSGRLVNNKFVSSSSVNVSGMGEVALTNVPRESGTLLIRFEVSGLTPVRTQNGILYAVALNPSSGVDDVSSIPNSLTIYGYEPEEDASWTKMAGSTALDNRLFITNRNTPELVHDFFVGLSASPENVGEVNDVGFFMVLEFL